MQSMGFYILTVLLHLTSDIGRKYSVNECSDQNSSDNTGQHDSELRTYNCGTPLSLIVTKKDIFDQENLFRKVKEVHTPIPNSPSV